MKIKKIKRIAEIAAIFLIISQLGKHFWPEWSFVNGLKVDYLSPTLNVSEVLILLVLGQSGLVVGLGIVSFLGWLLVSSFWGGVFKWIVWIVLLKYCEKNSDNINKYLRNIIVTWVGVEFFLSIGQMVNEGSLGGIWYLFGERTFSYMTPGIALISWFGENHVRAYGSFSHPNSLAGFMLLVWTWWNLNGFKKGNKIVNWVVWWMMIGIVLLTGSRAVWMAMGLEFVILARKQIKNKLGRKERIGIIVLTLGLILLTGVFLGFNASGWDMRSGERRWEMVTTGFKIFGEKPLLGVGWGKYFEKINENIRVMGAIDVQPIHNIFLYGLVEGGVVGLAIPYFFLKKRIKKLNLMMICVIVMTGMFDHYWLTLVQNRLLLGLMLGLG